MAKDKLEEKIIRRRRFPGGVEEIQLRRNKETSNRQEEVYRIMITNGNSTYYFTPEPEKNDLEYITKLYDSIQTPLDFFALRH